jgi:hypothetical protein
MGSGHSASNGNSTLALLVVRGGVFRSEGNYGAGIGSGYGQGFSHVGAVKILGALSMRARLRTVPGVSTVGLIEIRGGKSGAGTATVGRIEIHNGTIIATGGSAAGTNPSADVADLQVFGGFISAVGVGAPESEAGAL